MGTTSSTKTAPVPSPTVPLNLVCDLTKVPTRTLRRRSVLNLLRMGHGVPTVMQNLLDACWWARAGLPRGIKRPQTLPRARRSATRRFRGDCFTVPVFRIEAPIA